MSIVSPAPRVRLRGAPSTLARAATAVETLAVFSGILLYLWRWQASHPRVWMLMLAGVIATHFVHGDTLRDLGLTASELVPSARVVLPLMLLFFVPMLVYGFARHLLVWRAMSWHALDYFAGYGSWCVAQQYLTQSYFHNRLMTIIESRHLSSVLIGVMFGAAHIPNPILMGVTTLAGFIFAEVFARHRNIWPLALAQTVGGFLVAAISPPALLHNMRVGPGYFFYRLR